MATDGMNIAEDAEMAECEGDKVVTMMDVLQEQQEFEEDANAVLGASDDKNCTYAKGAIKRQAIYACLTCCPDVKTDPTKRAGVCLACSLMCHENHELVELYTKRNFRCDCGNPKFNSHPCQFTPNKPDLNEDNIYNQNFSGLYCVCHRPYPDPEATTEDDMIQCIICEDWLHASHLNSVVPANDQYSEMICKGCMEKNLFLHDYSHFTVNIEAIEIDVLNVNGDKTDDSLCNGDVTTETLNNSIVENKTEESAVIANGTDVDMSEKNENKDGETTESGATNEDKKETEPVTEETSTVSNSDEPESESAEVKETNESAKQEDATEGTTKNICPEAEPTQNSSTEDKVESTDSVSEPQEQKNDESDVKADEESTNRNNEDTTEQSSENATTADKLVENAEQEANNTNTETEESSANQTDSVANTDEKLVSESDNVKVADTSQAKESEIETSDDKTDSVMDAIDELLKDPTEKTASDTKPKEDQPSEKLATEKENIDSSDTPNANLAETSENEEKSATSEAEKTGTDVEMTDSKVEDENPATENIISDVPQSTKTDDNTETDETSKIDETAADSNNANVDDTEKPANSDIVNENDALNDTDKDSDANLETKQSEITNENKRKLSTELAEETSPKKIKLDEKCVRPKDVRKVFKGATFWPSNFRQKLCTCGACISMYKDLHVLFLTDPEDTVSAYESLGKENVDAGASQYEKGLQALSSLDRIQQINALTEYNKMRDKLLDFLKSFKDRKEIVREEDIKAFFAGMKPKREPDGVYFCR